MKQSFILLLLFVISEFNFAQTDQFNPSGIYNYEIKTFQKNGETYGYSGSIKVFQIDSTKILVSFYVNKGAPSYNSGSFIDTLFYSNDTAIYRSNKDLDPTCELKFCFTAKGVNVELKSENINFACGFGHAVDASGYYIKSKSKPPTAKEILSDIN